MYVSLFVAFLTGHHWTWVVTPVPRSLLHRSPVGGWVVPRLSSAGYRWAWSLLSRLHRHYLNACGCNPLVWSASILGGWKIYAMMRFQPAFNGFCRNNRIRSRKSEEKYWRWISGWLKAEQKHSFRCRFRETFWKRQQYYSKWLGGSQ